MVVVCNFLFVNFNFFKTVFLSIFILRQLFAAIHKPLITYRYLAYLLFRYIFVVILQVTTIFFFRKKIGKKSEICYFRLQLSWKVEGLFWKQSKFSLEYKISKTPSPQIIDGDYLEDEIGFYVSSKD